VRPPEQPLLCVVHIPKTAGTAIRGTLTSTLGPEKIYWVGDRRPISHWQTAASTEFDCYAVVGGHVSAASFEKISGPKAFMAVVREPIRRAISLFDFIKRGPNPNHPLRAELENLSLIEAIETSTGFRGEIANRQCALIGGAPNFSAALRCISEREWFIDCHESVDELWERICKKFGWVPTPLKIENANQREGYSAEYFTDDVVAALKELNKEDAVLYETFYRARRATGDKPRPEAPHTIAEEEPGLPSLAVRAFEEASDELGADGNSRRIYEFTPEDDVFARKLVKHGTVLIIRFGAEPSVRPAVHVQYRTQLSKPRVAHTVGYLNRLVSKYLLGANIHLNPDLATVPETDRELACVFQVDDCPEDVEYTLAYCANGPNATLIPDLFFWLQRGYVKQRQEFDAHWIPWKDRKPLIFWRGSSTGAFNLTAESIFDLPRVRLCGASTYTRLSSMLDARLTDVVQARTPDEGERIKALLKKDGLLSDPVSQMEFLRYRFQVDIDGNSNSWSFLLKLLMGSCILKVGSNWRQWYYTDLRPWEHFVPVRNDLSDLEMRMNWCLSNTRQAEEIALAGMNYARSLVFDEEMKRAAAAVLRASRNIAIALEVEVS
jgi:glycosyl transferase family 90